MESEPSMERRLPTETQAQSIDVLPQRREGMLREMGRWQGADASECKIVD